MKRLINPIIYLIILVIAVFWANHEAKLKRQTLMLNTQKHYYNFFDLYEFYFKEYFDKNMTAMELHVLMAKQEDAHYDFYFFSKDKVPLFSSRKKDLESQPYSLAKNVEYFLSRPVTFYCFEFIENGTYFYTGVKKIVINDDTFLMVIISDQTDVYNSYKAWSILLALLYVSIWTLVFAFIVLFRRFKSEQLRVQQGVNMEEYLDSFVNDNKTFSMLLNSVHEIEQISSSLLDLLKYNKNEVQGFPISDYIINKNLYEYIFVINIDKVENQYEIKLLDKNRQKRSFLMSMVHYHNKDNVSQKLLLVFQLIDTIIETENKYNHEVDKNSFYSSLTNLKNSNETCANIMDYVAKETKKFVDYDFMTVFMLENNLLICQLTTDPQLKVRGKNIKLQIGQGLTGVVAKVRKSLIVNNTRTSLITQQVDGTSEDDECLISVPLISNDVLYGVITISRVSLNFFEVEDQKTIEDIANLVVPVYEREALKQKLITSDSRFLTTIKESPMGIIIIRDNFILFTNKQFQEFLKYDEKILINSDIFSFIDESYKSVLTALLTSFELNNETGIFEVEFKDIDNKQVFLELSFSVIEWDEKKCILIAANNVTKRKELNEHLLLSQKLESLGSLSAGIAHDFKNILAGIMGAADLLLIKSEESSQTFKYAKVIKASAHRGASLSMQLLNFSSSRKQDSEVFDLNEILKETTQIINYTFNKNISTEFDLSHYPLHFKGELVKIQQCILNLCVNARDAMPNGGTLKIKTRFMNDITEIQNYWSEAENKAYSFIEVSDTGYGVPENIQKQIFTAFFTTKEKNKGTGLGLSTTQSIVMEYNGYINLHSKLGEGTSFFIFLPWAEHEKEDLESFSAGSKSKIHNILLVDDEPIVLEVAKELLEELGCTVYATDSGFEALDMLAQHPEINLALIDRIMPKMDGFTLLKKLKVAKPEITVIFASGYIQESDVEEFKQHGATDFILKPYKLEELIKLLNNV